MQKNYTLESILAKSGARNQNALKGMLDLTKCTFKDGVYSGLDEQIAQIKKDNDWLFTNQVSTSAGSEHYGSDGGGVDEFEKFRKL